MKASQTLSRMANSQQQLKSNSHPQQSGNLAPTSPICRCRVIYLGSSVPHITKDGLQGIQEPLRELYPDGSSLSQGNAGIDSWLSVWSNGILIENVDETGNEMKRFFKIEALHYCAAVKYVENQQSINHLGQSDSAILPKFLPLDSPHARLQLSSVHPPIFASILRRTTGIKVLECHAFICKREAAANALVRCCFHAYADTMYAKQIGAEITNTRDSSSTSDSNDRHNDRQLSGTSIKPPITTRRSKSIAALNESEMNEACEFSDQQQYSNPIARRKSNAELSDSSVISNRQMIYNIQNNLKKNQNFSKSMHAINQPEQNYSRSDELGSLRSNQSMSYHNISKNALSQQIGPGVPEPLFNPYSSRVPSYPPQNIIDQQQTNTGTLRSVKSVAANSIKSTLLRSKKHAKAMSMAQLSKSINDINNINSDSITSFHQPQNPHHSQTATVGPGSFMTMPPIPPMFLPNVQGLPLMNGSQTMKLPGRHNQQILPPLKPHINIEAMTPKELKKLLKKSAKYGIDPTRLIQNGLSGLPGPMQMPLSTPLHMQPPPPPPQMMPASHMQPILSNKSGTMSSQSLYSFDLNQDVTDYGSHAMGYGAGGLGLPLPPPNGNQVPLQPIKSILVKPNTEFLKSKAGKKWLKQQKEFKKLLPPHLDGLPIVFGPPPLDALEPADRSMNDSMGQTAHPPMPLPPSMGLPMMDSNGYYNPHPFYGPSGRASAASTLVRYSPQMMHQPQQLPESSPMNNNHDQRADLSVRGQPQPLYCDPMAMGLQRPGKPLMMMAHHGGNDQIYSHYTQTGKKITNLNQRGINHREHNHMIEQSVISLGDEGDGDDDDLDDDGPVDENQMDGFYDRVDTNSYLNNPHRRDKERNQQELLDINGHSHLHPRERYNNLSNDEQTSSQQANDDHSSHSSGIYRRKHINERAFSYSIRQEHKSNSGGNTLNSDADYMPSENINNNSDAQNYQGRSQDTNNSKNYVQHYQQTYEDPRNSHANIYQNRSQLNYARNSLQQQQATLISEDMDLSTRLDQQLNMKSFANSGVASHM